MEIAAALDVEEHKIYNSLEKIKLFAESPLLTPEAMKGDE